MGTLAFWVRTDSVTDDVPIFCASDKDDNKSFFRIKIRQGLILQAEVYNDEDEVSKLHHRHCKTESMDTCCLCSRP